MLISTGKKKIQKVQKVVGAEPKYDHYYHIPSGQMPNRNLAAVSQEKQYFFLNDF